MRPVFVISTTRKTRSLARGVMPDGTPGQQIDGR
jgi:hypothetical protein